VSARVIWVTGGRGFAGRYLCRELVSRGYETVVIDRSNDPDDQGTRSRHLELSDVAAIHSALIEDSPESIVHLAAQSSGAASFVDPGLTLRNNLDITLGILQALRELGDDAPRLLSAGSCEEYGPPAEGDLPLQESQPLRPSNPYAVSKAAQTLLCQQYRRAHGLRILCTRSFTHTGPGQRPDFVWSSFASQVAELERRGGGTLRVGNLDVSRDLSDVRDIARAYADLLDVEWPHDVVNLCSGREVILREALGWMLDAATCDIDVQVDPARLRPVDVHRFVGDPARLREMIGWVPSMPIATTLHELLEDWRLRFRDQNAAADPR